MIKVGILGTPNKDTLVLPDKRKISSWGGIVYNILPLAHYLSQNGSVLPICPVGEEVMADFLTLLRKYNNILFEGLVSQACRHNRITLNIISHTEKEETAELNLPPLTFDQIQEHLPSLDFLLINFTSGRDLEKSTLRRIRQIYRGPILVDVHSLTLGDPDAKGRRRLRPVRDWQAWLQGIDYVQMTWDEANSFIGQNKTTMAGLVEVADWLLQHGTRGVVITRGERGVYYFHADEQGILKEEIPSFPLQAVVDTTGCGDVFSAAFIYHLLRWGGTGQQSLTFANRAAALKATFCGLGPWTT